jgi:hypothetical protein
MEYQTFVGATRKGEHSISLCLNEMASNLDCICTDSFGCEKHSFYEEAIKKT